MLNNDLPGLLIVNRILNKPLIHLLINLILYHLLHVFLNVWELFEDLLEDIFLKSKGLDISLGDIVLKNINLLNDVVVVDHLSRLEISLSRLIFDNTVHDEIDILRLLSYLANVITFGKPLILKKLQVLGVEVIISIL